MTTIRHPSATFAALAAIILVVVLAVGGTARAATADGYGPFVDADGSIHEPGVAAIWQAGVTRGCATWRYCPTASVTRGELAAFIARAVGSPPGGDSPFVDVSGNPFEEAIAALAAAGIAPGCSADSFCPDRPAVRGEVAEFLAGALNLPPASTNHFTDDDGDPHEDDIDRLAAAGISSGCGDSRFCPAGAVTRAELATLITRAFALPVPQVLPRIPTDATVDYRMEVAPTATSAEGWRWLVSLFFQPTDVDRAVRIIDCESHGDPSAVNPLSGASGLFQHIPRYWPDRSSAAGYPGASIVDPEANVAVAAWLVYHNTGWGNWVCTGW